MATILSVTENSLIGTLNSVTEPMLGSVGVPETAFNALRQFVFENENADGLFTFTVLKGAEFIRVRHYVGLLLLPDGNMLEILPKIEQQSQSRPLLLNMLRYLRHSPFRTLRRGQSKAVHLPLWEIFITAFLDTVEPLAQQGIQQAYVSVESNERFWKGRFQATRQLRENSYHAERLAVVYDELTANVPPNRILKSTLLYLANRTRYGANQRRIQQLLWVLDDVPVSDSVPDDLTAIQRSSRLFARYEAALLWAKTLLLRQGLGVKTGKTPSLSLLFPMEQVFEDYVAHGIRTHWPGADKVRVQESSVHLVDEHVGSPKFKLRPDIIIHHSDRTFVLDTKWKRVNGQVPGGQMSAGNYGIEQADMYQLYAYGKKYAADDLFLIYPVNETFAKPLPVFEYDADTRLHVVPFDLTNSLANEVDKLAQYALSFNEK
ncbi:McrC family protein [Spirosoma radiotolerans]|uniref:Restriction endonuclease n=1 Tax=Spirosoma radiotolerans TaxID=1379870 RepID=A0A0E3ZVJ4_9BACT|nr:McrC family protein [Spirosoma radiotolerans]AKD55074.1 restriction endonuclease [Spirosoma radiotolerans]